MTASQIRQAFLDFFESKGHTIVPSAPIVVKNDPTLMFTNAGMNQFKAIFLGEEAIKYPRVADTQRCLRVSGKHNDLEEVGIDTYHHTMFEMLGNWSFGDYFKKEAIAWSWELLTEVYKLDEDRLYVTYFEGDEKEGLVKDQEAYDLWAKYVHPSHILPGNKKDNFWEMGETGPCGPCSEIHFDSRPDAERKAVDGATLVNGDHDQVIEIWNNVFMQFNRLKDGSLQTLPAQHVDTGMGFERLVRVLQGKSSNYDTDVFQPLIQFIAAKSGIPYGKELKTDIAMRVMADHIRAISFAIADGQLPSNNKAGYVIRRILRRAVRYSYQYLNFKEPFLNQLVPLLAEQFDSVFPELVSQKDFVQKVVLEEEIGFLRTLENGISVFESTFAGEWKENNENTILDKNITNVIEAFNSNLNSQQASTLSIDLDENVKKFIQDSQISKEVSDSIIAFQKTKVAIERNEELRKMAQSIEELKETLQANKLIKIQSDLLSFTKDLEVKFPTNLIQPFNESITKFIQTAKDISSKALNIPGEIAFKLQDTYGFPIDLTQQMARETGSTIHMEGFEKALAEQKNRSRLATAVNAGDWVTLRGGDTRFVGYDQYMVEGTDILKYRKVVAQGKEQYHIVLSETPFYPEGGGQVGDTGMLTSEWYDPNTGPLSFEVKDTKRENGLIIHICDLMPTWTPEGGEKPTVPPNPMPRRYSAFIDQGKRMMTSAHHTATHLLNGALRQILGDHVSQKGSLVNYEYLRFDFSHFSKISDGDLEGIERTVNSKIRECIQLKEERNVLYRDALERGVTAAFGEKYGDWVRVITFDPQFSQELCGGTHVKNTGEIGFIKIISESAVAAGVRRIEAVAGVMAENYVSEQFTALNGVKTILKNPKDLTKTVADLLEENARLKKEQGKSLMQKASGLKQGLADKAEAINGINFIAEKVELESADAIKNLAYSLKDVVPNLFLVLAAEIDGKPNLTVMLTENLVKEKGMDAGKIIRELAKEIQGGGGGQPFYATAGGKDASGIQNALDKARNYIPN